MRWLLLKDLQILRRSPLLVALLMLYPVVSPCWSGSQPAGRTSRRSRSSTSCPRQERVHVGGKKIDAAQYATQLFESIKPVRVETREEALQKVRDGDALAAFVLPADSERAAARELGLDGRRHEIEVYYNAETR